MNKEGTNVNEEVVAKKTVNKSDAKTIKSKSSNEGKYISYERRVLIYAGLVLLCLILATVFLTKSFSFKTQQQVIYQESSNLDYKVYLKKNDFYETDYLEKNMIYVASLIDKIDIDFSYLFDIDRESTVDFDYDIVGKLIITDSNGQNTFFEKNYNLLKSTSEKMNNEKEHSIKKSVSVDYDYYNNLANKFRSNYGIDADCNLIVYLNIHKSGSEDNHFSLKDDSVMSLTIPLSEKAVNIKMDYKEINNSSQLFTDPLVVVGNYVYIFISLVFIVIMTFLIVPLVRLLLNMRTKKTPYDKYIDKILNEYDRLIVETTTAPSVENLNVININSFNELLDVRDNLNLPIKYFVVNKHQKCNFYINHDKELYLLVIKDVDINDKKKGTK